MSGLLSGGTAAPVEPQIKPSSKVTGAVLAAFFITLLVGAEIVAVVGASTWAIASSMHVSSAIMTGLESIAFACSMIATLLFARLAYRSELRFRSGSEF